MAKTGALWERKEEEEEDDDFTGPSNLFLNRAVSRDFRVNEIFRAKALSSQDIELKEGDEDDEEEEDEEEAEIERKEWEKKAAEKKKEEDLRIQKEMKERIKRLKEEQSCTKEEYAVAKHLRFNTPTHVGRMAGMTVKCFVASEAVNCLLDSKWAKGKASADSEIVFTDRRSVVSFMNKFLSKGLFHRADKVLKKDRDKKKKEAEEREKKKKKKEDSGTEDKEKTKSTDSATDEKKSKKELRMKKKAEEEEKEKEEKKKEEKKAEDKSKTKKFKLNMSEDQRFVDGSSVYVWIYDPIHPKTFFIGFLMLVGAIALCVFPLWPDWMRIAVYYASLLGASFVGFMLFLIVFRVIIFALVWVLTLGKHHFWIFPNLTEDVGVIESFRPLVKHDIYPPPELEKDKNKDKDKKETKDDAEEESENDEKNDNGFEMVESKDEETNEEDGEEGGDKTEDSEKNK